MLRAFFVVVRRVLLELRKSFNAFLLFYNRTLLPKRFRYGSGIKLGKAFKLNFDASASMITLGNNVEFRNFCQLRAGNGGKLSVGNNVFFNSYCSITCLEEIVIGDDTQFGEGVKIYDANHSYNDFSKLISQQGFKTGKVIIGNNCWIGSNVVILKNVRIGSNSVIGANCVIHKSVDDNSVVIAESQLIVKRLQ